MDKRGERVFTVTMKIKKDSAYDAFVSKLEHKIQMRLQTAGSGFN
jgi:hypothetical protein